MSATKHDGGKPMMGLVSGIFLRGLAQVLTFGAKKYAAHNWRKGFRLSRPYDALQRHLVAFWDGEDLDQESGLPHLDHAACELMFLRELWQNRPDLDDRYKQGVFNEPVPVDSKPVREEATGPRACPSDACPTCGKRDCQGSRVTVACPEWVDHHGRPSKL